MYQWSVEEEMAQLGRLQHSQLNEIERLRAEALEAWREEHPSFLVKAMRIFRPQPQGPRTQPEPLMARSVAEAELLGAISSARGRRAA